MNNPEYILNELNKGIKMGMDSISNISSQVIDKELKDELKFQYDQYNKILNQIDEELKNYDAFPKELNPMQKAIGWMSIKWSTIDDKSDSKIAQMMLQGLNMGVIEGVKLSNHNPNADGNINTIINTFVNFQENSIQKLKTFL